MEIGWHLTLGDALRLLVGLGVCASFVVFTICLIIKDSTRYEPNEKEIN